MANTFTYSPKGKVKRSKLDLSHNVKLTCDMGWLIPINCMEVLPGDVIHQDSAQMVKFEPLVSPVMHDVYLYMYSFFVPRRILLENGIWEAIIGGPRQNGTSVGQPTEPRFSWNNITTMTTAGNTGIGSLWDYLGLPPVTAGTAFPSTEDFPVSAAPHCAYQRIYDEYFRNDAVDPASPYSTQVLTVSPGIGQSNLDRLGVLRRKNWEKDYFTSALPWPNRGETVYIPGVNPAVPANGTIDNLRTASALKLWLETAARAGVKYVEHLRGHWGVHNGDARLQRPEWLCGSRSPIIFNEVLQTSSTDSTTPQANMAGHGMTIDFKHRWRRRFTEDGFVMTLMSVMPKTTYSDGIPRMFSRVDRYDFAFPEFANLSEQAIRQKEIKAPWLIEDGGSPDSTFGYTGRFNEYRYLPSRVHGKFRSTSDHWHLGRQFFDYRFNPTLPSDPVLLNPAFISGDPSGRIFAVNPDTNPQSSLDVQIRNNITAIRSLPKHAIPKLR